MRHTPSIIMLLLLLCVNGYSSSGAKGLSLGILRYGGGDWYSCISSVSGFLDQVKQRFGLQTTLLTEGMKPGEGDFFRVPLFFLNGHGKILFTTSERVALRRYLENGGFLFANDDYGLDTSFRHLLKQLFPGVPLVKLPPTHPIYRIWYTLPRGLPKIHKHKGYPPAGYGLYLNGRMVIFYAYESDIFDGWDPPEVHKDPPALREAAFQVGYNVLYYALTR